MPVGGNHMSICAQKKNHYGENSHILIKHILNKNIALFFLALDDMSNY